MDLEGRFVMLQHLVISDASAILKVIHSVPKWIVGETWLRLVTFDGSAVSVNS